MTNTMRRLLIFVLLLGMVIPGAAIAGNADRSFAATPVSFTILHTNDFHGQLEASGSNPGIARLAAAVNEVRAAVGAGSVLLVDSGDEMQGSLLSNLQKGLPTIAALNAMGYDAATLGNHEFDWGQPDLVARAKEATFPFVTANIVQGSCDASNWTPPSFAKPFAIKTVGAEGNQAKVAFIGVTTKETPTITIASATASLCFKDPAESILHYYDALKAQSDVIVVLSHLGFADGGYGYGIPVYGDQTLAQKLIDAGKPVPLIIGGHSHTDVRLPAPVVGGKTTVTQAYYNGRQLGRADLVFDPATKDVSVNWQKLAVSPSGEQDLTVAGIVKSYTGDAAYQALINQPVGYAQVDLLRDYNGDNMMGNFIDDSIYNALNADANPTNDVDLFFNNAGGIRTDWCAKADLSSPEGYVWSNNATDCSPSGVWNHAPMLLNYGQMFTILPFGNATVVGKMTGAHIMEVLNQSATLGKGAIQPSGIRYKFYSLRDDTLGPQPYAFGAYGACVVDKTTRRCDPLDPNRTYKVGTNEFLAPAGGDNFTAFKYMTDISYWGDMLNAVNGWVSKSYTAARPYKGPNGDGLLDGRITRTESANDQGEDRRIFGTGVPTEPSTLPGSPASPTAPVSVGARLSKEGDVTVVYLTVANNTTTPVAGFELLAYLPEGAMLVNASPNYAFIPGGLSWVQPAGVDPGQSTSGYQFKFKGAQGTTETFLRYWGPQAGMTSTAAVPVP